MTTIKIHSSITEISPIAWNKLIKDQFLLSHEFLACMETNQCIGDHFGWITRIIALYQNDHLMAVMPLYKKYNNYGEFVFDYAWADAFEQSGLPYYPKLVSTIPYTPATGQRLLAVDNESCVLLLAAVKAYTKEAKLSGLHSLFFPVSELKYYQEQDFCFRQDIQYHWHNQNYHCFDDFLSTLVRRKRKNIIQERRRVEKENINIRVLNGHKTCLLDWQNFILFYQNTFYEKSGIPTINLPFFLDIAKQKPDNILLILADLNDRCIAGALMYISGDTLYGRHWGCIEEINSLHFELCYYQGIEYCIQHGLQRFESGAQGQHKMARGFIPTLTTSAHWITDADFHRSIHQWCKVESEAVTQYYRDLQLHSPYRT
jgi:predicted N-acyltransferase